MLLDTSGLFCYFDKTDRRNSDAIQAFNASGSRLTHSYVLAEFVALAESRRLQRLASLQFVEQLEQQLSVEVVYVDRHLHDEALDLLLHRLDKQWSLCDAVSFVLMASRGLTEALTTDHHFEQAGFVRLLTP
jgi:uncharacterized protein